MYNKIIIIGLLISIIFIEFTQISPSGFIVPAYMVLCLRTPQRILYTLIISILSFVICKVISKFLILYGRRRFFMLIVISFLLDYLFSDIIGIASASLIGVIIPGIIANEFEKQGILKSLLGLVICVCIITAVLMIGGISVISI